MERRIGKEWMAAEAEAVIWAAMQSDLACYLSLENPSAQVGIPGVLDVEGQPAALCFVVFVHAAGSSIDGALHFRARERHIPVRHIWQRHLQPV